MIPAIQSIFIIPHFLVISHLPNLYTAHSEALISVKQKKARVRSTLAFVLLFQMHVYPNFQDLREYRDPVHRSGSHRRV